MLPLTNLESAERHTGAVSLHETVERVFFEARNDVYYYILSFGLAAHEAQDLSQEVFLRFYLALRQGENILNPRGWLFRVAHNLALHGVDRSKTHRLYVAQAAGAGSGRSSGHNSMENPEQRLVQEEYARKIRDALATLSHQQRLCLQLRAEGLRYAEIANQIGVGVSTVGEFLSRAIKKLRKAVHE